MPLPNTIPVFPLSGTVLLPGAELPLNIFEPRYLAMVEHAADGDGVIGMIQPIDDMDQPNPQLFDVGCAGRITHMEETAGNRYLIRLAGVSRFHLTVELATDTPYRVVEADYSGFHDEYWPAERLSPESRDALLEVISGYLAHVQVGTGQIESFSGLSDAGLVAGATMAFPLTAAEKQAVLQIAEIGEQAQLIRKLVKIGLADPTPSDKIAQH